MGSLRTAVLLVLLAAAPARAGDRPIDVVVVVDCSAEMESTGRFSRVKQLLLDLVDRAARPGAQVAVIPFGDGVHEPRVVRVGHGEKDAAEARARLRRAIDGLRAHDPHRYLHAAVERGVRQLRTFARHRPAHERRLVLVATGSRHVPAAAAATVLADRLADAGDGVLRAGRDWTFWYGHFGAADGDVAEFVAQRGAGVLLKLDSVEPMRWTPVSVETPYVSVGELPEGNWRRRVRIFVSGVPGAELAVRCHPGTGVVNATMTAVPHRARLKRARSTVAVDLSGYRPAGAKYRGAHLRIDGAGPRPLWVTGARVPVDAGPDRARATLDMRSIDYGRVDRGTQTGKILRVTPNESARRRQSRLGVSVREVPPDVDIVVEPRLLRLDRDQELTIRVAPRAGAKPGTYESRVVLEPRDGLRLERKEVRVRYEVGHGSVRIEGGTLDFGDVVRGGDAIARLTLVPDLGAVESGAQVRVAVEGLPEGVELEMQRKFTLFGKSALEVRARVSSLRATGPVEATLRFEATANVRVVPDAVPVTIEVVPPPTVKLGELVEIGRVRQAELDGHEFSFPVDVDPAHHGTVVELAPDSAGTRLEPAQLRLREGRQWLRFRLVSDRRSPGKQAAGFTVFSVRDGRRRREGSIRVAWTVEESYLRFLEWRDPPPLSRGANMVHGTLVLDASPDLRGRVLDIRTRFPDSGPTTRLAAGLDAIELLGGSQSVTVPFDVVLADPGSYAGVIELELRDSESVHVAVKPVPFEVVVPEPPPVISMLSPEKRNKLYAVGGMVLGLLLCLLWLVRRNRRPVHRMVRFTPPAAPGGEGKSVVDTADMFAFEEELR